jgi:hypothetical protein
MTRHIKSLSLLIQNLFICILLSSCTPVPIIIPLFPEESFQNQELQFLRPGETTQSEIKEHLWEPLATRNNGKLLLYRESMSSWVGWVGPGFIDLVNDAFLLIEINEDNTLKRYEIITRKEGFFLDETKECTSWGLCLDMEMLQYQSLESLIDGTTYIFFSPQIELSKLEHPPEGKCQIITYLGHESNFGALRVHIDENPKRAISKKGFLINIVEPGNHTFTADWAIDRKTDYNKKKSPIWQNISCNSGESLFVNVYTTRGIIRNAKVNTKIESIDKGLKILQERRLIID